MDSGKFNKYKTAADIAELTMSKAIELCQQKMKASYVCTFCDTLMKEKLAQTYKKLYKGISLPTCLSINGVIAHDSYTENDDYEIQENDIIKIELACHIDNCVSSVGDTIKIGDINWTNDNKMKAAINAMQVGIQMINPGTELIEYKKYMDKVVKSYGYHLVQRPNVFHDEDTTIFYDWAHRDNGYFCEPSWIVKKPHELELYDEDELSDDEFNKEQEFTVGEIYHISVVLSNSPKVPMVSERNPKIFQKTDKSYLLKSKHARELLNKINNNYSTDCFKLSNIDMPVGQARLGLRECLDKKVVRSLGIPSQKNSDIILLKCSIAIQENSVYKLTGRKHLSFEQDENLNDELNNILTQDKRFDKRAEYLNL